MTLQIRRRPPPARFLAAMVASVGPVWAARRQRGPLLPTWSFSFEWMVRTLRRDGDALWRLPAPQVRQHHERLVQPSSSLRMVEIEQASADGVPVTWFEPPDPMRDAVLLYLHGGSYQFGSVRTHAALVAALADSCNVAALSVDYRLAPENPYPAALEDALQAWHWLVSHHVEPERIVLAGESAGGNLCLALMLALRERGERQPRAAALISPWTDLACASDSYRRNDAFDYGSREMLLSQAHDFAGSLPLDDPRLSPLRADLRGLPPLFVQWGSAELLCDDCEAFAGKAAEAGVHVVRDVLRDMPHAAPLFADLAPEAGRGRANVARFVRTQLEEGRATP